MARTVDIYADSTYSRITDLEGTKILLDIGGGLGEWSFSVSGNDDLTSALAAVAFRHDPSGATFGAAKFTEIASCNIGGVDVLAGSANLQDIIEGIGSMLTETLTIYLPAGASTSANQVLTNTYIGADETGTTLRGRLKTFYDGAVSFWASVTGAISGNKFQVNATSLPLPTGAATAAKQDTINTSLVGLLNAPIDTAMAQDHAAVSVRPTDYFYEVVLGLREGNKHWDIWGYNIDVDTGTEVVRSLGGTTVSNITTPTTFTFVSTSANDTSAGTGARSLLVYYVDSTRTAQVATVTLNGLTPVVGAFSGLGINRIKINMAGSGQANAGVITCTETTGGMAVAEIRVGEGTNQSTVFYIESLSTALINGMEASIVRPVGGTAPIVTLKGWVFSFITNAQELVFSKTIDTAVVQSFEGHMGHPFPVVGGAIFWFEATTDQNNTQVSIRYSLIETKAAV